MKHFLSTVDWTKEELQDIVPPSEEVEDSNSMGVENLNL